MKFPKLLAPLALAVASMASSAAQAATIEMGTLAAVPTTEFAYQPLTGTSFTDTFKFTLSTTSNVFASLNNVYSGITTPWYSFTVYDTQNLFLSLNGGESISNGQSTSAFSLAAGDYSAVVTGLAVGLSGGMYSVSMAAQPVPVPAAVWLLGSGLLGLVGVARRKA